MIGFFGAYNVVCQVLVAVLSSSLAYKKLLPKSFALAFVLMFCRRITAFLSQEYDHDILIAADKFLLPGLISSLLVFGVVDLAMRRFE